MQNKHFRLVSLLRLATSLVGIFVCIFIIVVSARAGLSRLLQRSCAVTGDLAAANKAVALAPADPESHRVRAAVLYHSKQVPEAERELELAVNLRPQYDYAWLELAFVRDELENWSGALAAFNEVLRLAPHYAYPRWQRGNFLLRMNRFDEAFEDLRFAASSNPDLVPSLIDLAWGISKGDAEGTERLAQVTTNKMRITFAAFLAKHGRAKEAIAQFAAAGSVPDQTRVELVRHLVSAGAFQEAFTIWNNGAGSPTKQRPAIQDGGFEGALSFDESGFGWRVSRSLQAVKPAADLNQHHTGSKSLLIEFLGDSSPESPLVSQLIPVEPSRRYQVNFAARSKDTVAGGLPFAVVEDAAGERKRLGESRPLPQGTSDWQLVSFTFQTAPGTNAIVLSIRRRNCTTSPCPIFGSIWLDSFSIGEVK